MKQLAFVFAMLMAMASGVFAAEPEANLSFEQRAPEAVARAVFKTIAHFYRVRSFNPGELIANKDYPVRIAFSAAEDGNIVVSASSNFLAVEGRAKLNANVSMSLEDNAKTLKKNEVRVPNFGGQVVPMTITIKSGNYDCSGAFKVDGKKVTLKSGEAEIAGNDVPVKFSDGTKAVIDGKEFTFKDCKWEASESSVSTPTPNPTSTP